MGDRMHAAALSARAGAERLRIPAIVVVVLLPLLMGLLLTWGLSTPALHLDRVNAAIVNDDVPATINGKSTPLGRQFAAGLMKGSAPTGQIPQQATQVGSNFTWVLTNDQDASDGLAEGRYAAVVTIPASFSTAIASLSGDAQSAVQALVRVKTSPSAALLDPALVQSVTAVANSQLNRQIIDQYLQGVYQGFNSVHDQIAQASDGAQQVASGADSLASGAQQLADGANQLDAGLGTLASQSASLPGQTEQLADGASQVSSGTDAISSALGSAVASLTSVQTQVCQRPGRVCDQVTAALGTLQNAATATGGLSSGADQVAAGAAALADASVALVDGIDQSAAGASSLVSGAASLTSGAEQVSSGADQLSSGLAQAVQKIPSYSDSDIRVLSEAASQPVVMDPRSAPSGIQSAPLFTIFALWVGGLVLALARRSVPESRLLGSSSSLALALRSTTVGAVLGAVQGLVLGAVMLIGLELTPGVWAGYLGSAVLIGAAFAAVNQGLAAALGAIGRLLAVLVGVVGLAVGIASSVPASFVGVASLLPTAPALTGLRGAVTGEVSLAVQSAALVVLWGVIGVALVLAGIVSRRRLRVA
jgi:putative membrane protein